jgi:hypothetical protein
MRSFLKYFFSALTSTLRPVLHRLAFILICISSRMSCVIICSPKNTRNLRIDMTWWLQWGGGGGGEVILFMWKWHLGLITREPSSSGQDYWKLSAATVMKHVLMFQHPLSLPPHWLGPGMTFLCMNGKDRRTHILSLNLSIIHIDFTAPRLYTSVCITIHCKVGH